MPYRKKKKRPLRLMMTNLLSKCEESDFLKTLEGAYLGFGRGKNISGLPPPHTNIYHSCNETGEMGQCPMKTTILSMNIFNGKRRYWSAKEKYFTRATSVLCDFSAVKY